MVMRSFLLIAIVLLGSCSKKLYDLTMTKTPYPGNELRVDGFYYSTPTSEKDIGIAVFYKNGVCIHMFTRIDSHDTLDFIENEILQ